MNHESFPNKVRRTLFDGARTHRAFVGLPNPSIYRYISLDFCMV